MATAPGRWLVDLRDTAGADLASRASAVAAVVASDPGPIRRDWELLCWYDPELPPKARPPLAAEMVGVVLDAMTRPQPLAMGPEPAVTAMAVRFARAVASLPDAIEQMACLREIFRRLLWGDGPEDVRAELSGRMHTIVDRAIAAMVADHFTSLSHEMLVDPLTTVGNRRAFQLDSAQEIRRAARYGRRVSIVMVDHDHLKALNDSTGHAAGDDSLKALGAALATRSREQDRVYRIGGDEFAMLLSETDRYDARCLMERIARGDDVPEFSWGIASYPTDGADIASLLAEADRRLYAGRAARRGTAGSRRGWPSPPRCGHGDEPTSRTTAGSLSGLAQPGALLMLRGSERRDA